MATTTPQSLGALASQRAPPANPPFLGPSTIPRRPALHRAPPVSASPEEQWCRDIGEADIGPALDKNLDAVPRAQKPIAAVYSPAWGERIYVQDAGCASMILEIAQTESGWKVADRIEAADAAPATRLSAVTCPRGGGTHLFYVTQQGPIQIMVWTEEHRWSAGPLMGKKAPKISPSSWPSVLHSANHMNFTINICELSFTFASGKWTYSPIVTADRGTPMATTCYAALDTTAYHIYYQARGVLWERRSEAGDTTISEPSRYPRQPYSALSVVSWFAGSANTQTLVLSGPHWLVRDGAQMAALQTGNGVKIRIYTALSHVALGQMAFGIKIKPKMHIIYPGL
ncbi:hypothetical protein MFIFM68171_02916 [Madurella fahalii]|uniref:Fucose-specific lectin n=1 Tax=Madurella fahalii TaxID=1157608 RepID=A0ABQ0G4L2_9PEZI